MFAKNFFDLDNMQRMLNLHSGKAPKRTHTYVYCDEKDFWVTSCIENALAVEWDSLGYIWVRLKSLFSSLS